MSEEVFAHHTCPKASLLGYDKAHDLCVSRPECEPAKRGSL